MKTTTSNKVKSSWTWEQDDALMNAVGMYGEGNWQAIVREVSGNKNGVQCLQRWKNVLNPRLTKGPWTKEEDALLEHLISEKGTRDWASIAKGLQIRSAKQCRDRWTQCLDPNIYNQPWQPWEDDELVTLRDQYGNAWALIAKNLEGRTVNAVKSRWKSINRKQAREWTLDEDAVIIQGKKAERPWKEIVAMLPKRKRHAIQKRWKALVNLDPSSD